MSDAKGINVLAICGSLRAGSYNRSALRTAIELKPPGMTIETADIGSFPLYNALSIFDRRSEFAMHPIVDATNRAAAAVYGLAARRRNSRSIALTRARYVATTCSPQRSPASRRNPRCAKALAAPAPQR